MSTGGAEDANTKNAANDESEVADDSNIGNSNGMADSMSQPQSKRG